SALPSFCIGWRGHNEARRTNLLGCMDHRRVAEPAEGTQRGSAAVPCSCPYFQSIISVAFVICLCLNSTSAQNRRGPGAEARYNQGLAHLEKQETDRAIVELKRAIR